MRNVLFTIILVAVTYAAQAQNASVPFELANDSREAIHLIIPGKSKTIVAAKSTGQFELSKGQKIFYTYQGRQYTLLTVTEKLEDKKLDLQRMVLVLKQQIDNAHISR